MTLMEGEVKTEHRFAPLRKKRHYQASGKARSLSTQPDVSLIIGPTFENANTMNGKKND